MKKSKTSWINELKEKGYTYMISLDGKSVYATKTKMLKNGEFRANSNFDEFELINNEDWPKNRLLKKFYYIGEDDETA